MYLDIVFLCFLTSVYVPNRTLPRLHHACPDLKPQNLENRYTNMARRPDLAPIEHVWGIFEHNRYGRCRHDVRIHQRIIALRCPRITSAALLVRCVADALMYAG